MQPVMTRQGISTINGYFSGELRHGIEIDKVGDKLKCDERYIGRGSKSWSDRRPGNAPGQSSSLGWADWVPIELLYSLRPDTVWMTPVTVWQTVDSDIVIGALTDSLYGLLLRLISPTPVGKVEILKFR
jgi:hypothetical protein